ncbi:hypothetical protein DINM_003792 [Dirofilaria immitis]|nr:hypothetical protein [Dirofilaria immitis]
MYPNSNEPLTCSEIPKQMDEVVDEKDVVSSVESSANERKQFQNLIMNHHPICADNVSAFFDLKCVTELRKFEKLKFNVGRNYKAWDQAQIKMCCVSCIIHYPSVRIVQGLEFRLEALRRVVFMSYAGWYK